MNKRLYIIIIVIILLFTICGVLHQTLFLNQRLQITPEDAERLCYSILGEKDEKTGFPFSFGVTETIEKDGKKYYVIRASWFVNNNHMSYIGNFFVSMDGKEIYNGFVDADEYIIENLIWKE